MKKAILAAQKTSDEMIAETEKRCARMLSDAEGTARTKTASVQHEIDGAEERVASARRVAQDFIAQIEQQVQLHLSALESLKRMDLNPAVAPKKPYDFETEADESRAPAAVAREIGQSVDRIVGQTPQPADPAATRVMEPITDADLQNARFSDLKFGKNYDPHTAG